MGKRDVFNPIPSRLIRGSNSVVLVAAGRAVNASARVRKASSLGLGNSVMLLMNPEKGLHVTDLLPILLPVKSLTINNVADVTDFSDLCINLSYMAIFDHKTVVRWWPKTESQRSEVRGQFSF